MISFLGLKVKTKRERFLVLLNLFDIFLISQNSRHLLKISRVVPLFQRSYKIIEKILPLEDFFCAK